MEENIRKYQELIVGCKRNERKHQEALYRIMFSKMLPMVRRHTSDEDDIISIMNDGFLKVFKKIDKYSGKGSFEGWVRKLIYHSLADHFRSKKLKIKFIFDEQADLPYDHANSLEYDDLINIIEDLPKKEKDVFELHAIYGYTHPEIGKMLHLNENTSKWLLANARKRLKEKLVQLNYIQRHA